MKKKIQFIMLVVFSMFFLVGWGEKKVKLLDDTKLIDLDKAIEYVRPGGEWEQAQNSEEDTTDETETTEEDDDDNTSETEDIEPEEISIEISVNGENILYGGNPINDLSVIEKLIRRDNKEYVTFILVDDWAESETYKEAIEFMKRMKSELGIRYTSRVMEG